MINLAQIVGNSSSNTNYITNEDLDQSINEILTNSISDNSKINQILNQKGDLLKKKYNNLAESTYLELVQLFIRNGYLNHASFFLCQMDKLKIKIPRRILDLFLESNVSNNAFDKSKGQQKKLSNKFDDTKIDNQDFNTYNLLRNNFSKREDLQGLFTKLKVDAKPYIPKESKTVDKEDDAFEKKFSGIDPSKVKEFVPKNYKVVKKN